MPKLPPRFYLTDTAATGPAGTRQARSRQVRITFLIVALFAGLAACSKNDVVVGGRGEAPVRMVQRADCPHVGVLADAADLTRFRPGHGEDLTDMVLDARVMGVSGNCDLARRATNVDLSITIQATRGPAAGSRTLDVPYFVAVSDREGRILDKQVFQARFEFPPNRNTMRLTGEEVRMVLPTTEGLRGRDFAVSVGLQVDATELAFNRRRGPR